MTEFDYDVYQRKNLARQAKYRKNGSKSKRCTLPSDRMTQKQWKERCGNIVQYHLSAPMSWQDFKRMPHELQQKYICELQKGYGATSHDFGVMFGVKPLTVRRFIEQNGIPVQFKRGVAMNAEQKQRWQHFLSGESEKVEQEYHDLVLEMSETNLADKEDVPVACQPENQSVQQNMKMTQFSLHFNGTLDVDMMMNSLRMLVKGASTGSV